MVGRRAHHAFKLLIGNFADDGSPWVEESWGGEILAMLLDVRTGGSGSSALEPVHNAPEVDRTEQITLTSTEAERSNHSRRRAHFTVKYLRSGK